jgi:hypothetical protein
MAAAAAAGPAVPEAQFLGLQGRWRVEGFVRTAYPHEAVTTVPLTVRSKVAIGETVDVSEIAVPEPVDGGGERARTTSTRALKVTYDEQPEGRCFFLCRNARTGVVGIKTEGTELRFAPSYVLVSSTTHRLVWRNDRAQEAAHGIAWTRVKATRSTTTSPSAHVPMEVVTPAQLRKLHRTPPTWDDKAKQRRHAANMRRQAERRACICASSACAGVPTVKIAKASTPKKDAAADQQPEKLLKGIQLQRNAVKMAARRELAQRFGGSSAANATTAVFVSLLHLHPAARATGNPNFLQLGFNAQGLQHVSLEDVDQYFIKMETSASSSPSSSTYLPRFNYPLPEAAGAQAARPSSEVVQNKKRQHTMNQAVSVVAAELQKDPQLAESMLMLSATTESATPFKKVSLLQACRGGDCVAVVALRRHRAAHDGSSDARVCCLLVWR